MDDQHYIKMILGGNVSAYADLVNKYKDMVYTLALRVVKNPEDAEEIAQDAFVKAYRALPDFKENAKFTTWLFRIVYNTAISKIRSSRDRELYLEEITTEARSLDSDLGTSENLEKEEVKEILQRLLETLSAEDRMIVTLYYLSENSVEEISQITGLSKSNVKVKLFRSRNKLRSMVNISHQNEIITIA